MTLPTHLSTNFLNPLGNGGREKETKVRIWVAKVAKNGRRGGGEVVVVVFQ
jgi:hypothetical protein